MDECRKNRISFVCGKESELRVGCEGLVKIGNREWGREKKTHIGFKDFLNR